MRHALESIAYRLILCSNFSEGWRCMINVSEVSQTVRTFRLNSNKLKILSHQNKRAEKSYEKWDWDWDRYVHGLRMLWHTSSCKNHLSSYCSFSLFSWELISTRFLTSHHQGRNRERQTKEARLGGARSKIKTTSTIWRAFFQVKSNISLIHIKYTKTKQIKA